MILLTPNPARINIIDNNKMDNHFLQVTCILAQTMLFYKQDAVVRLTNLAATLNCIKINSLCRPITRVVLKMIF